MWTSICIRMHTDFKLDVLLKRFCEVTRGFFSCELQIQGFLMGLLNEARSVAPHLPGEVTPFFFSINWCLLEKLNSVQGKPRLDTVVTG